MAVVARWLGALGLATFVVAVPSVHYRADYAHHKRLRTVAPRVLYRSGQLTAEGFRDAVGRFGLRTVVNVQNDFPDPAIARTFWDRRTVPESELCRQLGVRYVFLNPDLCSDRTNPAARPKVIDEFLALLDDPANHPVLLHCKAGLHPNGMLPQYYIVQ